MLNIKSPATPDMDLYADRIGALGTHVYIDYNKYVVKLRQSLAYYNSAMAECLYWIRLASLGNYRTLTRDSLIRTLVDYCGLNDDLLMTRNAQRERVFSVDQTKVMLPLKEYLDERAETAGEGIYLASHIVDSYLVYKQYKSLYDQSRAKLSRFLEADRDGWCPDLRQVSFKYEMKETGRFYTYDDNLQNWNLNFVSSICAPKDYFLFWCDFNQIDFRVGYHIYLREPGSANDKIYLEESDKYRAMYKIICAAQGVEPDLDLFKKFRPAYKKAILSAMYNASENTLAADIKNRELAHQLKSFFNTNAKYQEYLAILNRVIDFNVEVPVRDYFGFLRTIPIPADINPQYGARRNTYGALSSLISQGCNTPIQATSNSILVLWLNALLDRFAEFGLHEDKLRPYLIRHDECIFMCHKDIIPYLYIFKDFMQIALDNWNILELEEHLGIYYKEPLDWLEEAYQESCEANKDKLHTRVVNEARESPYRPIADVIEVYTYSMHSMHDFAEIVSGKEIPKDSSEEELMRIIESIANDPSNTRAPMAQKYIQYHDRWIIKSNKLNKYKMCSDLSYPISVLNAIGGSMLMINNCTQTAVTMFDDVYVKMDSTNSFDVSKKLRYMEAHGYPEQWIEIPC